MSSLWRPTRAGAILGTHFQGLATLTDPLSPVRKALGGRYEIKREIGRGGMAIVYLARDLRHDRDVAIKALRPELSLAGPAARFIQEIRITDEVRHPRILEQLDSGDVDGVLYYVTPYVRNGSLETRLRRESPLTLDETLRIARQVAEGLDFAHSRHVVHRDIKPANILLEGEEAIIADFGIARVLNVVSSERLTAYGMSLGTPEYMSPEQCAGDRDIDHRSDIYSLGCVVYEMLAGEPPFTGPTSQAIQAKHMHEPLPSLRVVRRGVPEYVQDAVETALAKTPADRFASAELFVRALSTPKPSSVRRKWRRRAAAVGGGLALAAVAGGLWLASASQPLDVRKVVVYPLLQVGRIHERGEGEAIALMIGSALEHTEPLKWIYGWTWLDSSRRADISLLDERFARRLARARGARYFVDGSVVGYHDSASVILRLLDSEGDSLVAQATASGPPDQAALLGLRAVNELLPRILDPGRKVNLDMLAGVRPASTAAWLQGEREFRRSHFPAALGFYRRALAEDSTMALAAVRGAEAAFWSNHDGEAQELADIAVAEERRLPVKYAQMARGLQSFVRGFADSAVYHFERAVGQDSSWAEGWMALGDAYYHLVPSGARPDSVAEAAFVAAQRLDPDFSPPLIHLSEIALRRGQGARAQQLTTAFQRSAPDSAWIQKLDLMNECVRRGAATMDWRDAAHRHPDVVVQAAKAFTAGGANLGCAEGGFRAAYSADSSTLSTRWGALLGLEAVLIAQGKARDAREQLQSAIATGIRAARGLYAVSSAAGVSMDSLASGVVQEWGATYVGMPLPRLWHQGLWAAHTRDTASMAAMVRALREGPDTSMAARFVASGLQARLLLSRGDSSGAIALLEHLHAFGSSTDVTWGLWQPEAFERLLLAEVLLARKRFPEAVRVAGEFDHPQPILYVACLPRSLQIRYQAALALGNSGEAERYAARLRSLGRRDLVVRMSE